MLLCALDALSRTAVYGASILGRFVLWHYIKLEFRTDCSVISCSLSSKDLFCYNNDIGLLQLAAVWTTRLSTLINRLVSIIYRPTERGSQSGAWPGQADGSTSHQCPTSSTGFPSKTTASSSRPLPVRLPNCGTVCTARFGKLPT